MKQYVIEGRRLLTEDAAAEAAGVDTEAIRRWDALGLLEAVDTPAGPRYDREAIRALLVTAWQPDRQRVTEYLTPQQASRMLGVGTPTLTVRAREGRITYQRTHSGLRRYLGSEIRAVAAERDRLRDPKWWPEPKTS